MTRLSQCLTGKGRQPDFCPSSGSGLPWQNWYSISIRIIRFSGYGHALQLAALQPIKGTSNNPNFVAILRCSKKITPYICAIDTLLRSSRLREMAPAVIPAPDGSAAPCHDRICCVAIFCSRLVLLITSDLVHVSSRLVEWLVVPSEL
jgi:hypothetical protein